MYLNVWKWETCSKCWLEEYNWFVVYETRMSVLIRYATPG